MLVSLRTRQLLEEELGPARRQELGARVQELLPKPVAVRIDGATIKIQPRPEQKEPLTESKSGFC